MTEREICIMYREARNQNTQLQILAELNDVNRNEIIQKYKILCMCPAINRTFRMVDIVSRPVASVFYLCSFFPVLLSCFCRQQSRRFIRAGLQRSL